MPKHKTEILTATNRPSSKNVSKILMNMKKIYVAGRAAGSLGYVAMLKETFVYEKMLITTYRHR